jgi:hypothetical protein
MVVTSILMWNLTVVPTRMMMFSILTVLNPGISAVNLYFPDGRLWKVMIPVSEVIYVFISSIESELMYTIAPGRGNPSVSVSLPLRDPVCSWARTLEASPADRQMRQININIFFPNLNLLEFPVQMDSGLCRCVSIWNVIHINIVAGLLPFLAEKLS